MNSQQQVEPGGRLPQNLAREICEGSLLLGLDGKTIEGLNTPMSPQDVKADVRRQIDGWQPKYYPMPAVIRRLNDAFSYSWSFKIISWQLVPTNNPVQVIVHGQLSVDLCTDMSRDDNADPVTSRVVKDAFGQASIKLAQVPGGSNVIRDLGSDMKAAASDSLRKAATMFGIGLEIYESDESSFQGHNRIDQQLTPGAGGQNNNQGGDGVQRFQVENVLQIIERHFGMSRGAWLSDLKIQDPGQISKADAESIIAGTHPYLVYLQQHTGKQFNAGGLKATNA